MKDLENSTGSVASEYDRYMDSTEAKVKQFKEEVSQIWTNLISSDLTRGVMDAVNELIKVFGNGKTMLLGFATILATIFKGKVGNDLLTSFTNLTKKIITARQEGELLSKTVNKIGKTQLILGGLTAGLMVFDIISSKAKQTEEDMKNFNKETVEGFSKSNEEISNVENLLSQKQDLENKLNDNTLTSSQQVDLKQQLYDVERQIAELLPNSVTGYDEQNKKIAENTELIQAQIEAKKQSQIEDAKKVISNNSSTMFGLSSESIYSQIQQARALKETIDNINSSISNNENKANIKEYNPMWDSFSDNTIKIDESTAKIEDYKQKYDELITKFTQNRLAIIQLQNSGMSNDDISSILGISTDSFNFALDELNKVEEKAKEVKNTDLTKEKMFGNTDDVKKFEEQIRTTKEIIGDLGDESGTRSQQIRELEQSLKGVFLDTFNGNETTIGSKIYDISYALNDLSRDGELSTQSISNLAKALPNLDLANMSSEERVKALTEALKEQRNTAEQMSETSIKTAQATITNTVDMYSKIEKYQEQLKENGGKITASLAKEFSDEKNGAFADFLGNPEDINQVTEYFKNKMQEIANSHAEALDVLNANSNEYYQGVIESGDLTNEKIREWASNFMDVNSDAYHFDLNEYGNIQQAKQGLIEMLSQSFAKVCSDMTGIGVEEYEKDMSNYTTIQEAKQDVAQKLGQAVSTFLTDTLNISADTYSLDYQNFKSVQEAKSKCLEVLEKQLDEMNKKVGEDYINMATYNKSIQAQFENKPWIPEDQKLYKQQLQAQWDKDVRDRNLIGNKIAEIEKLKVPDLDRNVPGFNPDKPSSGSSSGSGNKGNSNKTINHIDDEIDRYHDLKESISTTQQALDKLANSKENAFGENKINLMNQEISKYDELARKNNSLLNAYNNRINEVRNSLSRRGITFDSNGAMTNYYNMLTSIEKSLNNQMNADNQKALQEEWKTIKKLADEYTSLYETDIPNATKAINDANKNIYNSRKELLDLMMKSETKVSDIIKKSINDEIKLREKQIEALQKLHEEEKQGEKLAKNEEDLIKLRNQMDKVEGVDNKKYAELKKQYDELLQTSNNDIRDDVYDKQNKALDEEKNKYDELMNDSDKMTKLVQDALNTGVVKIFGETKNIQEEMVKLVNEENIGLQNRVNNLKEINDLLRESKAITSQINSLDVQLGLNGYISKVTPSNTNTINLGNSTYNISGMDENKVRNIVEKEMNSSFERIAKQLGLKI